MGVVSAAGQIPPQRGSELALETLQLGAGETREVGDAGHDVLLFAHAGGGELGGRALESGSAALLLEGEAAELAAGADGISLVRITLGGDTDLHAPMGARDHVVAIDAVEPGKATGSRSFQILFGPHNGSRRATMFVGYVPPGKAPWHYHLYDEIVWIWRGPGRYYLGEEVEPLEDGCAFRITPREVHIVENTHPERELAVLGIFTPAGSPSAAYLTPDIAATYGFGPRERSGNRGELSLVSARVGAAIRGEFPIFEHKTYLNSCSQGALSHRVRAAYEEYLAGWDENGAEWEFWVERSEAARAGFAELIHGDADEVAVTTSVSQGVNGIVSALPFERGGRNRIVISEYEFPTVGQIAHAQELRGAEVVHVRPDADGSIPAERFAEAIDERTALVCCTTISYRTGHRHDVSAIAEVAHASGALVLADSYQAAGAIEVDVRTLGADFVTGGTVKYLLASAGLGFLWVRREVLAGLTPTQTGWFADEDIFQMDISDYSPHATARRFDAGTPPVPNIYAGVAGLGLVQETGVPAIEAHVSALNTRLIAGLNELGADVVTPADPARRGPLVCVRSTDAPALVASLAEENIVCSLRDTNLRIAAHYYNTDDDIDVLLDALSRRRQLLA